MSRLLIPGVPAAGHVDAGGWWHPGSPDGCPRGRCPWPPTGQPRPGRPEWCREHRRPLARCHEFRSTHVLPVKKTA